MVQAPSIVRRWIGQSHASPVVDSGQIAPAVAVDWFARVNRINRRLLHGKRACPWPRRRSLPTAARVDPADGSWKMACSTLGAEHAHRVTRSMADLEALEAFFRRHIDADGSWLTPIGSVDRAMMGYALLYLAVETGERRYRRAADAMARALLEQHPRAADGTLPYSRSSPEILVDSLAMISPFLTRYARHTGDVTAQSVAVTQLLRFVEHGVDRGTRLPYHGYYAGGVPRLGLHGWGRGTGWYMLGLVDTLAELPEDVDHRDALRAAFQETAAALQQHQRADGHWHWAVPHRQDDVDSSTTALIGYSLTRGLALGLLDLDIGDVVARASSALVAATSKDGVLNGSLAECDGPGKYPQRYGPATWLQGAATAFGAVYLAATLTGRS